MATKEHPPTLPEGNAAFYADVIRAYEYELELAYRDAPVTGNTDRILRLTTHLRNARRHYAEATR